MQNKPEKSTYFAQAALFFAFLISVTLIPLTTPSPAWAENFGPTGPSIMPREWHLHRMAEDDGEASSIGLDAGPDSFPAKHLVVLAAFNNHYDDNNSTVQAQYGHPRWKYDALFNWNPELDGPAPADILPSGSVRDYHMYNTYNTIDPEFIITEWVRLPEPESYYAADEDRWAELGLHALARVDAQPGIDLSYLLDGDYLDPEDQFVACTIIVSGHSNLLPTGLKFFTLPDQKPWWTCRQSDPANACDIQFYTSMDGQVEFLAFYTVPALWGTEGSELGRLGPYCRATAKMIYDLTYLPYSAGKWALMGETGDFGFDNSGYYPSHISAINRMYSGFSSVENIEDTGYYQIGLTAEEDDAIYRIPLNLKHLTIKTDVTPEMMKYALSDPNSNAISIQSVTVNGAAGSYGIYRGGHSVDQNYDGDDTNAIGFDQGIVICTGDLAKAFGPNVSNNTTTDMPGSGGSIVQGTIKTIQEQQSEGSEEGGDPVEYPTDDEVSITITFKWREDLQKAQQGDVYFHYTYASEELGEDATARDVALIGDNTSKLGYILSTNSSILTGDPITPYANYVTDPCYDLEYEGISGPQSVMIDLDYEDPCDPDKYNYDAKAVQSVTIALADVVDPCDPCYDKTNPKFYGDSIIFIPSGCLHPEEKGGLQDNFEFEYLIIENRQPVGYETSMPHGGLAIWHVNWWQWNEPLSGKGSPQLAGWPENGIHAPVAIQQADGNYDIESTPNNFGDITDLFYSGNASRFDPCGVGPNPYPNTKTYLWGVLGQTDVTISNISVAAETMSFIYRETLAANDDPCLAIPIEVGEYLDSDGTWYPIPEGFFDPQSPNFGNWLGGPCPGLPEGWLAIRFRGDTIHAAEGWIPDSNSPKRWRIGSSCAGYDTIHATEKVDYLDNRMPVDPIDVWHTFKGKDEGNWTVSLCSSDFDTTLEIYDSYGSILNYEKADPNKGIACNLETRTVNGEDCYYQSQIQERFTPDQKYYIRIAGNNASRGNYTLLAKPTPAPSNDLPEQAIELDDGESSIGTNVGASDDNVQMKQANDTYDVWYLYMAPDTGSLQITVAAETLEFYPTIMVFDDVAQAPVAFTMAPFGPTAQLDVPVTEGQIYYIRVAGEEEGEGLFEIDLKQALPNDLCSQAIPVSDFAVQGVVYEGDLNGSTPTPGHTPQFEDTLDVWYRYTPKVTENVTISLCGSYFDTTLELWDGCPNDGGALIDSNDDAECSGDPSNRSTLLTQLQAGETYYIRIAAYDDNIGYGMYTLKVTGGQGNSLIINEPHVYNWLPGEIVSVCLSADYGTPPYYNWMAESTTGDYWSVQPGSSFNGGVGAAQGWQADDQYWTYALPFSFEYYGAVYNSVNVCSNGFLDFVKSAMLDTAPGNSVTGDLDDSLDVNVRIAPLWQDLTTSSGDIYIDAGADYVTFRWDATHLLSGNDRNFAVTLFDDGSIRFDYGDDNITGQGQLAPTVGIASGNPADYLALPGYNDMANLGNANSVLFTPPFEQKAPLPDGLTLDLATGCISGTINSDGQYLARVTVRDSSPNSASAAAAFTFNVLGAGDANGDFVVDLNDITLLHSQWMQTSCGMPGWCGMADLNRSGTVDWEDLDIIISNWLDEYAK